MCIFCANEATKDCFFNIVDRKECLLDKKVTFQKKSGKSKFSKGLVHGFCQKVELVTTCVCWANQAREDRFLIFWIKKKCSLDQKSDVSKN